MIRKKTGLKELTILMLASAAFVSVACGDDDDDTNPGTAGTAGSGGSSTAGSGAGGKAGSGAGGKAGSSAGGKAGSDAGGKAGSGNGGTGGGTAGTGGTPMGGEGGVPPEGGGAGEGGEPMGGAPMGGAGGEGGATEVVFDTLLNGSFENGNPGGPTPPDTDTITIPEWTNVTTPAGKSKIAWTFVKDGQVRLAQWNDAPYTATVEQEISPIANGTYSFSVWVTRKSGDGIFTESYIYAKGFNSADAEDDMQMDTTASPSEYVQIKIDNIVVDSGKLKVGFYTETAAGDGWINFDHAELTPVVTP